MPRTALIVGGTGPSGPHLVQGLLDRGYEPVIFHRGLHEADEVPEVEHIHGDPHFEDTIAEALDGRDFELVLALYGRIRHLAKVLRGRCERFVSVGGAPGLRGQLAPDKAFPFGLKGLLDEQTPTVADPEESAAAHKIGLTEQIIFGFHEQGAFSATHLRYPQIYGPRQVTPREWSVVRRVLDGRRIVIAPDGGLVLRSRASGRNAAHAVLLTVDHPKVSHGEVYNVADDDQYTVRQWHELTARCAGGEIEVVGLPEVLARPFHSIPRPRNHMLLDTTKLRATLGYTDAVTAEQGLQETVDWLREHPVTSETHPGFPDHFDYEAEDAFLAAYQRRVEELTALLPPEPEQKHSYAHPKREGGDRHGR